MEHVREPIGQSVASVSVVIVNFNGGPTLLQCLAALHRQSFRAFRILVMDNASHDGSIDRARTQFPECEYRELPENLGFAAANNLAISRCDSEFVALLNPDAIPEPDWLGLLVAAAMAHPDAASFGSRQLLYGQPDTLDGTGDVYHCSGLVWRRGNGLPSKDHMDDSESIFSPCAAAALYRRQAVLEAGGFDEDYFCYLEDVDLGFRLRLANWHARYVRDAVVHHVGSLLSGGRHGNFAIYHGHRNMVWTFVKDMPGWLFWLALPWHIVMNIAVIVLFTIRRQGAITLRAKCDAIRGLRPMLRKRHAIQSSRKCSAWAVATMLDWALIPRHFRSKPLFRIQRP